jgi:hypothetical protein
MDHLCSSDSVGDCRFQDAPFANERNRYLSYCAPHGARLAARKVKRYELRWIARRLAPHADRGVGTTELMPIALERQNLRVAATAARRVIEIGRPWLRFLGWWTGTRRPVFGLGPSRPVHHLDSRRARLHAVDCGAMGRTTRRFLRWCAERAAN